MYWHSTANKLVSHFLLCSDIVQCLDVYPIASRIIGLLKPYWLDLTTRNNESYTNSCCNKVCLAIGLTAGFSFDCLAESISISTARRIAWTILKWFDMFTLIDVSERNYCGKMRHVTYESNLMCVIRAKSATDSDRSRPPNMIEVGHPLSTSHYPPFFVVAG